MVRIFKSTPMSISAIAGEMLNLENNLMLFEDGKVLPKKTKIRQYPKIKSDNCTIIPRLTVGWIELISNTINIETFITTLLVEVEKMEKFIPKQYHKTTGVLNVGIDSFCEVQVTSLLNNSTKKPRADGLVKRRIVQSRNNLDHSKENCQFLWVVSPYMFLKNHNSSPLAILPTIVYDEMDVFMYKNNSFYLKELDLNKLKCMNFKTNLLHNDETPFNITKCHYTMHEELNAGAVKYSISDIFRELCFKLSKSRYADVVANVYNVLWVDVISSVEINDTDHCESCGMVLYDDVYILLNGNLMKPKDSDEVKNNADHSETEKVDNEIKGRDITSKKPALVCPYCFPKNNLPDIQTYWALKTTHPKKLAEHIHLIKDKFARQFMMAMLKGEIKIDGATTDIIVKHKKATYILCRNEQNFIKRNPSEEDAKNKIYFLM